MKNSMMKKRIASIAAAAVMSVTGVTGTALGTAGVLTSLGTTLSVYAASSVSFVASKGYEEGAYAEWAAVDGASGYNVYCDGVQLDSMLVRQYPGYFRADAVGIKAGAHTLKVVPVISGKEDSSKAGEVKVTSIAHDRSGYGWVNGTSSGAYNEDGTLRSNAVVLYVTESTKDKVSMDVVTSSKGATTSCTGIQNILASYQKGYETRPLNIRFIGKVTDPAVLTGGDLLIKGNGDTKRLNCGITVEGIGNDATLYGFGIRLANCSNVEVRNIGVMLVDSSEGDNVTLQQSCDHIWVHHFDSFYGEAGSDADQKKGDGALDCKKSTYVTFSYNHFWDNGKCNLLGLSEGTTENLFITYHHNWYDHSDSRHPRIRFYTAHVYNNYYDGNAKYGIGSTLGSSVFSENNYFRNCKYPMLTAMQGTDLDSGAKGTFSGEDGGTIKSYGNYMEGQKKFVPYSENNTSFDAYVASSRNEKVPSSVKSLKGSNTYNNFDTASDMYKYSVDDAKDVPAKVMAGAGRLDGGDFKFTFDNAADDENYDVNSALKSNLSSYKSNVIAIGSGFKNDTTPVPTAPAVTTTTAKPAVITTTTTKAPTPSQPVVTQPPVTGSNVIYCSPSGKGDGKTMSNPTDVLSAIKSVPAGGTIYLLEGTYKFSETILIDQNNSGKAGAYKTISAYPGADVKFDFSGQATAGTNRGIVLDGSYWHFYDFSIEKSGDNGMLLSGNNNKIEMMEFNDNQDTGLQISRYRTDAATIAEWPTNNYILNCTSKNNCDDLTMENADGFAAKLTCGEGNVFDGCMAYNNSDDGWDLFAKTATGPIGVVTLKNCVAFRNGFTEFGEGYGDCDGNGFKLGGSGVGTAHVVENCLAFENLNCGFTDNNNPKLGSLTNCTAYNNGVGGNGKPNFSLYRCTDDGCDFNKIISYNNTGKVSSLGAAGIKISNDKFVGTMENSVYYNSKYYNVKSKMNITNGAKIGDIVTPSDSDFITLSVPAMGTDFHTVWRNADGSVKTGGFAETKGTYKDLGYHFDSSSVVIPPVTTAPPVVATTTEAPKPTPAVTTTTDKKQPPVVTGGYVHNFTENDTNSSFYTITGNLSTSKGSVNYGGMNLTKCLKLESATNIKFTAPSTGKLTLVFAEPAATIKVDGTKYTSDGSGIISVDLAAGAHEVTKADSANLFYMAYETGSAPVQTTTTEAPKPTEAPTTVPTTTEAPKPTEAPTTVPTTTGELPEILFGDADENGKVEISDAVAIMSYCANSNAYPLTESGLNKADVYSRGDGVNNLDALAIQKKLANIIASLPESTMNQG